MSNKPPEKAKPPEKPKSPEAARAVMKPEKVKKVADEPETTWRGGVDHFSERV